MGLGSTSQSPQLAMRRTPSDRALPCSLPVGVFTTTVPISEPISSMLEAASYALLGLGLLVLGGAARQRRVGPAR